MTPRRRRIAVLAGMILGAAWGGASLWSQAAEPKANPNPVPGQKARSVGFAREVRPILSDHCFTCHGPDTKARKAGLRLDTQEGAFGETESGVHAVVPGKPAESELIARIESKDPDEVMPPRSLHRPLAPEQVAVLRRWIEQGAPWTQHWAYKVPVKSAIPAVKSASWPVNEVDRFILERLEDEGLRPEPEAGKSELIRRVSLDLTGLPATPEQVDAFLADKSDRAYERVVDRLLDSPRYGEHMARFWLDAARYGDTHGLHLDNYREIWPYRDWVIRAFNDNKPFDRFVIEQLAGDLLPNPTLDQIVATGFNRCHISTSEGGSIEEEVYVRNVVDQIDTNGTIFLGLTIGCSRCHDHKYDPVRMKDYYQLFSFFNNIDGPALDGNSAQWAPVVRVPTDEQRAKFQAVDARIAEIHREIARAASRSVASVEERIAHASIAETPCETPRIDFLWIDEALPAGARATGKLPWNFTPASADRPVHSGKLALTGKAKGMQQFVFEGATARLVVGKDDILFVYAYIDPKKPPKEIMLQWHVVGGEWRHRAYWGANAIDWGKDNTPERRAMGPLPEPGKWVRLEVPVAKLEMKPGTVIDGWALTQQDGVVHWDASGIVTKGPQDGRLFDSFTAWAAAHRETGAASGLPENLKTILASPREKWSRDQIHTLAAYFAEHADASTARAIAPLREKLAAAENDRKAIEAQAPTTMVFRERSGAPKPAYLLKRGEYDQQGEKVGRSLPAFLPPMPPGEPANRLGLARWLVAPNHPLTARVAVNRFWLQLFGNGIVKTAEDFGSQGEPPTHPELLDWLAVQFREDGWDVKRMMKRLVMSATYRQSSRVAPEKLAKDPENRLLARGPRYRLDAETIRDQALFVAGLLSERLGGPSVKPPQPSGLWEAVGYTRSNTANFSPDHGHEKVHRRSLYIFWKRTSAPPQMTTFDAPSREACTVRRERTNTPLQALLLMNETQMIEASRGLAERVLHEARNEADRLDRMFRLGTCRFPDDRERTELKSALADFRAHYHNRLEDARKLTQSGETKPDPVLDAAELAAWTMMGNIVLNLDEVVSK